VAEAASEERRGTHCQNNHDMHSARAAASVRYECAELSASEKDRRRTRRRDRDGTACVDQRGDLRVRIDRDETGSELVTFVDLDQPRHRLGVAVTDREQFLEEDRHLLAIRCRERVELERCFPTGVLVVVGPTSSIVVANWPPLACRT